MFMFKNLLSLLELVLYLLAHMLHGSQVLCFGILLNRGGACLDPCHKPCRIPCPNLLLPCMPTVTHFQALPGGQEWRVSAPFFARRAPAPVFGRRSGPCSLWSR